MAVIMLPAMKLVDQWRALEAGLPEGWESVRLALATEQQGDLSRAAQVLGPLNAGRAGSKLVFEVTRGAGPNSAQRAIRFFGLLDAERTWSTLEVDEVAGTADAPVNVPSATPGPRRPALPVVASWNAALAELPSDWSDLLCELEIQSSALLDRTALLCAPINPTRVDSRVAFTFRCSSLSGYGVSAAMARRCFERMDEEGIAGQTRVLRVLSDTDKVYTQGPVWLVGGKML
jgi:hypothetical protein